MYHGLGIYNTPKLPTGMERFGHMIICKYSSNPHHNVISGRIPDRLCVGVSDVVMDEVVFFYGHWWLHANRTSWFN